MAGPVKRPGPRQPPNSGRARRPRNLAAGSTPATRVSVVGEDQPRVDPPVGWRGVQLHLFVVVVVVTARPEPGPEPEPEPEDPGEQLPLPGFEPKTPADHLAAARAHLDAGRARATPRTKRPA